MVHGHLAWFPWPVNNFEPFEFSFVAEVNNPDLAQHSFIMSIKTEPNVSVQISFSLRYSEQLGVN